MSALYGCKLKFVYYFTLRCWRFYSISILPLYFHFIIFVLSVFILFLVIFHLYLFHEYPNWVVCIHCGNLQLLNGDCCCIVLYFLLCFEEVEVNGRVCYCFFSCLIYILVLVELLSSFVDIIFICYLYTYHKSPLKMANI